MSCIAVSESAPCCAPTTDNRVTQAATEPQRSAFQIVLVTTLNVKPRCHRYTTSVQDGCEVALAIIITMHL